MINFSIRAVVYTEDMHRIGQCLEHDIATQVSITDGTLGSRGILERMPIVIQAHYTENRKRVKEGFSGIKRAPQRFFDMWHESDYEPIMQEVSLHDGMTAALYIKVY